MLHFHLIVIQMHLIYAKIEHKFPMGGIIFLYEETCAFKCMMTYWEQLFLILNSMIWKEYRIQKEAH